MSEKIKIVYIINSFAVGGAERLLFDLCSRLDKDTFEPYVCTAVAGGPMAENFEALGLPVKIFTKKSKLGLGLIWQLAKYLREVKPQIVHTHLFGGDTWGRLAAILAGVPVIVSTEHNINIDESWLKKIIKLKLSWFTKKIIAVSQSVKAYSVKKEKINPKKITVIYNGIDLSGFSFKGYEPIDLHNKISAVTIARLEPQKGHRYLIEAMPLIIKKYPAFILNIVGAGSLENELKNRVKELNLQDYVIFWGRRADPQNILPAMDLFILPSLWEGLGIAILEAQASGVPVLAAKTGGIEEIIEPETTGLLFELKNSQAIFQSVEKLLSQPDLQQKIINNAYQQVKEKFDLEQMVSAYEDLYLSLINKKK